MTLQLLRDMWQRADTLYIHRADLESLHRMECNSTVRQEMPIPDQILFEDRKLSRYYIYLLFRYCMSSAGPRTCNQQGLMSNRLNRMCQWEPKEHAAPLVDVPRSWLETKVCTNYPSAPPIPDGNFLSGLTHYLPQQQPQPLPQPLEYQQQPQQQQPQQQQQPRVYHRDMDYTKQQAQRLPLQRNNKQSLYPGLTEHQFSGSSHTKTFKGPDNKPKTKTAFSKGYYDSNVESEEEY